MSEYQYDNPHTVDVVPIDHPLGEGHHTDEAFTESDRAIGQKLAWYMGDLFINCQQDSPREQWQRVARALRVHGLKIVNRVKI